MKIIEKLKTDKKLLLIVVSLLIATFVIPYITIPGLILWWFYKKSKFSKRFKVITTTVIGGLFIILIILASKATPTTAPKVSTANAIPTEIPAPKQNTPTPTPTPTKKPIEAGKPPTITYDINGFPNETAKRVTVSDIAKTPSVYADGVTNVVFTCKIIGFAKDAKGDATAVNCADPNDISSIVQIDIGNFDIKQINVSDTIRIYGFVMGVAKGKNGFGAEVTEAVVSGMYVNDFTSGYNSTK